MDIRDTVGCEYEEKVCDCYTMCRDFYEANNVSFPADNLEAGFWLSTDEVIVPVADQAGVDVSHLPAALGDVALLLGKNGNVASLALCLGEDGIMVHGYGEGRRVTTIAALERLTGPLTRYRHPSVESGEVSLSLDAQLLQ